MASQVQDGEQPVGTASTPARPVLYEDALFLLLADGRVPSRSELLVFVLGFAASISLVFITSDLMNAKPLRPTAVLVFLVSASYCGVLVRQQRVAAAEFAAEEERQAAEARRPPSLIIDRETRRQLLNYFVFCPPENDKKAAPDQTGSINAISSSFGSIGRRDDTQQEESDAIGSSGKGAMFSRSVRGVLSRLPALNNPMPDPPPPAGATSPPTALGVSLPTSPDLEEADGVNAQETSSAGECEGGGLAAVADDGGSTANKSRGDDVGNSDDSNVDAKDSTEGDVISDATAKNATALDNDEFDEEGSAAESCIVCFGDYAFGEELCQLPCRHLYHAKCIDEWFDGENHGWWLLLPAQTMSAQGSERVVVVTTPDMHQEDAMLRGDRECSPRHRRLFFGLLALSILLPAVFDRRTFSLRSQWILLMLFIFYFSLRWICILFRTASQAEVVDRETRRNILHYFVCRPPDEQSAERGDPGCEVPGSMTGLETEKDDAKEAAAESCVICFGDFEFGEELCRLPCRHLHHAKCIDEWLDGSNHQWCPLCRLDVFAGAAPIRPATASSSNTTNTSLPINITANSETRDNAV
eukprot:g15678.t1